MTSGLGLRYARLPVVVFIERVRHGDADAKTPQEVPISLLVPVSTRLRHETQTCFSTTSFGFRLTGRVFQSCSR